MRKAVIGAIILCAIFVVQATDVLVATKFDRAGGDRKWIRPQILVKNTGTSNFDLNTRSLYYYFYDSYLVDTLPLLSSMIWWCSKGNSDITITFSKIDEVTGLHGKKANIQCKIYFSSSKIIAPKQKMELKFGIYTTNWRDFNQSDDWSRPSNTGYYIPTSTVPLIGKYGTVFSGRAPEDRAALLDSARSKIKYVICFMQENRSFDHYFGTYPGADNIPYGQVIGTYNGNQFKSFHNTSPIDPNEAHFGTHAKMIIYGGGDADSNLLADKYLEAESDWSADTHDIHGALGYHDRLELPTYWTYADSFVLADRMFQSCQSWSYPSHLYMVSGWSAYCSNGNCSSFIPETDDAPGYGYGEYTWKTIVDLLEPANVDWRYYVARNFDTSCTSCDGPCIRRSNYDIDFAIWNPLPNFNYVQNHGLMTKIKDNSWNEGLNAFFNCINNDSLKPVSWIIPGAVASEHPGYYVGDISVNNGQKFVRTLINKIMGKPKIWDSCAIFVSWDDWGGFYDHVKPAFPDANGYGLRVPALLLSPYAKKGYIDHQELSHDAYLKFIEDLFLAGSRIDGDGRTSDGMGSVREESPTMGDLLYEFDFKQPKRAPVKINCP